MSGDDNAGRDPLNVPLPGSRQGFVEIVDVEEDIALRCGETAEIHQVSVAAGLYAKSGRRGQCQIGRHERGCAAIKRERRLGHAPEADWDQLQDSAFVGLAQKLDRIAPIVGRLPTAMRSSRGRVAQRFACGASLVCGHVCCRGAGGVLCRFVFRVRLAHAPAPQPNSASLEAGCIGPALTSAVETSLENVNRNINRKLRLSQRRALGRSSRLAPLTGRRGSLEP